MYSREMIKKFLNSDPSFPINLKKANLINEMLVAGDLLPQDSQAIAVIGARKCSKYGKDVVRDLVGPLVKRGITIVSGLAEGIDSEAHTLALQLGGRTIGVLGYGFNFAKDDLQYELLKQILKSGQGAIVSPFKSSQKPSKQTFINRNRIIAGLSNAVLVIEASEKSGTFYTVDAALNQGKNVYAVPGSIYSYLSRGTHSLIKDGAILVERPKDILI